MSLPSKSLALAFWLNDKSVLNKTKRGSMCFKKVNPLMMKSYQICNYKYMT
ncbi:hypothetical protein PPAR_a0081 [Pseudoalteromonas paragorgicola KMM 3548]|nr:hypothetical protein [Pseudoalteromonas distincta KMM 3548]